MKRYLYKCELISWRKDYPVFCKECLEVGEGEIQCWQSKSGKYFNEIECNYCGSLDCVLDPEGD